MRSHVAAVWGLRGAGLDYSAPDLLIQDTLVVIRHSTSYPLAKYTIVKMSLPCLPSMIPESRGLNLDEACFLHNSTLYASREVYLLVSCRAMLIWPDLAQHLVK
jgi:hypothetical protein